jgi:hypothetical protein
MMGPWLDVQTVVNGLLLKAPGRSAVGIVGELIKIRMNMIEAGKMDLNPASEQQN